MEPFKIRKHTDIKKISRNTEGYYILTKGTSTKRTLEFLTLTHQTHGYTCVKETLPQLKSYVNLTLIVVEIKTLLSPTISNLDKNGDMLD